MGGAGGAKSIPLVGQLDSLAITTQSGANFVKNSIIEHIANTGSILAPYGYVVSRSGNSLTYVGQGGYGVGIITLCEKNKTYKLDYSYVTGVNIEIMYYTSNGSLILSQGLPSNQPFTVPNNAEFVILLLNYINTVTFTINKFTEV